MSPSRADVTQRQGGTLPAPTGLRSTRGNLGLAGDRSCGNRASCGRHGLVIGSAESGLAVSSAAVAPRSQGALRTAPDVTGRIEVAGSRSDGLAGKAIAAA